MSTILVVNEIQDNELKSTNFETLTAARQLGDQINQSVTALLFGTNLDNLADKPGQYGADNTILVEDEKFEKLSRNCYSAAIAEVAKQKDASVVLMAASFLGKDIMSRAAQLLETSLAQDCISFRVNGDQIYFTRPIYAGKLFSEVRITSSPVMATIRPKSYKAEEKSVSSNLEKLSIDLPEPNEVIEEVQISSEEKLDVLEADIIVSGGRGLKGPENWPILEDLAKAFGAKATTGCSRPPSDEGWRPHDEHVGQTGKTVSPILYVACGISGAIQHIAGMSQSKYIVAINKDPEAPIFNIADYGIVGDLFKVVPAMTEEIKKVKE